MKEVDNYKKVKVSGFDYYIPEPKPSFKEMAEQMRINQEMIMKEISDHVDKEIQRLKDSINGR